MWNLNTHDILFSAWIALFAFCLPTVCLIVSYTTLFTFFLPYNVKRWMRLEWLKCMLESSATAKKDWGIRITGQVSLQNGPGITKWSKGLLQNGDSVTKTSIGSAQNRESITKRGRYYCTRIDSYQCFLGMYLVHIVCIYFGLFYPDSYQLHMVCIPPSLYLLRTYPHHICYMDNYLKRD